MSSIKTMQKGGPAPFELQVAFNVLAILLAVQIYDNFLKDTIGKGKTIDELVGLK
tara:strand:+ start:498 stop:662 length:165 start_codon:yes stop_codon:yes gene_type:complete